jgi:hypothetical protein
MSAPLNQLNWWKKAAPLPDDPPVWRDPGRLIFIGAAACLAVSSLIPWAVGIDPAGRPDTFRATQGTGEGVLLIATGVMLLLLARDRTMYETTNRIVQLLPVLAGLLCIAMWLGADHYARVMIEYWSRGGGTGELTNARYISAAGIAGLGLGTAWFELRRPAAVRQRTRPLREELGITRWSAAAMVAATLGGLLGALLAVVISILAVGVEGILVAVLMAVFGLFLGIAIGLALEGWVEARLRRREEQPPPAVDRGRSRG